MKITNFDINPLAAPENKAPGPQLKNFGEEKKTFQPLNSSREIDQDKIQSATNSIREYMNSLGVKLNFQFQGEGDHLQVEVVNPENDKVIRKIPSDEVLSLAESIEDMLGVLVNKEA